MKGMTIRFGERWMWAEACEMLERAERLHRQFFNVDPALEGGSAWAPPIDLFETERGFLIIAALPGVEPEDVQVRLERNAFVVVGKRRLPAEAQSAFFRRMEIPHGRFERRIELPPVRLAVEHDVFANGCLIVSLRKKP
jgi:HSP20 family molecular chaperone IbpA